MKRGYLIGICFVLLSILFSASVNADVSAGKNAFNLAATQYSPYQVIEGTWNISLINEPNDFAKAEVDSKQFSMLLYDFLKLQPQPVKFSCNPASCQSYYKEGSSSESLQLSLSEGSSPLIGLNIKKGAWCSFEDIQISKLSFTMTGSEISEGKYPLPSIDIGNDNNIEWKYLEPSSTFAGLVGNYNISGTSTPNDLVIPWQYCEKIKFFPSAKFNLTASATMDENLTLTIYNLNLVWIGSCNTISNQGCEINFVNDNFDEYYVCASADCSNSDNNDNCGKINSYKGDGNLNRGFLLNSDTYSITLFDGDFPIDVEIAPYEKLKHTIAINDSELILAAAAQDYLANLSKCDRNATNCIIPIKISSIFAGNLSLDSLNLEQSCWNPEHKFWQISEQEAMISMNYTELQISVFNASSSTYGTHTIKVSIRSFFNSNVFETAKVPVVYALSPRTAIAGSYTNFSVKAYSPKNNTILSYQWDFGDGTSEISESQTISHRYGEIGNFTLTVKAIDNEGLAGTGTFKITTAEPKFLISQMLASKKAFIGNFSKELLALSSWYKPIFTSKFDLAELNTALSRYEQEFKTTSDFVSLKQQLDSFAVPIKIEDGLIVKDSAPIFNAENINLDYLEKAGAGASENSKIKELIKQWQPQSGIKVSGTVKKVIKDVGEEDIATIIAIKLLPSSSLNNTFLIIQLPAGVSFNNVKFDSSYGQKDLNGALGIEFSEITSAGKTVNLALPGRYDINTLEIYASPSLDILSALISEETKCGNGRCEAGESLDNCPSDCPPVGKAIAWVIGIIIVAAVGIWAIWRFYAAIYENRQEKMLFKNKNDFIAITSFIVNARLKGIGDKEIREKLEKAGWNASQTAFAFMKVQKRKREIERRIKEAERLIKK